MTIAFRPDSESERALAQLTSDGTSASEAIRRALILAAETRRRAALRAEASALAADPEDREEARQVLAEMEALRA
jgi:hypothetical protein